MEDNTINLLLGFDDSEIHGWIAWTHVIRYILVEHHLPLDVSLKIYTSLLSMDYYFRWIVYVGYLRWLELQTLVFGQLAFNFVDSFHMLLKKLINLPHGLYMTIVVRGVVVSAK